MPDAQYFTGNAVPLCQGHARDNIAPVAYGRCHDPRVQIHLWTDYQQVEARRVRVPRQNRIVLQDIDVIHADRRRGRADCDGVVRPRSVGRSLTCTADISTIRYIPVERHLERPIDADGDCRDSTDSSCEARRRRCRREIESNDRRKHRRPSSRAGSRCGRDQGKSSSQNNRSNNGNAISLHSSSGPSRSLCCIVDLLENIFFCLILHHTITPERIREQFVTERATGANFLCRPGETCLKRHTLSSIRYTRGFRVSGNRNPPPFARERREAARAVTHRPAVRPLSDLPGRRCCHRDR